MKIGIIIFSHTGNTKSVALKLKEKLSAAGHSVKMDEINVAGFNPQAMQDIQFVKPLPDPSQYDALVFGAPVMAFSLTGVMKKYLDQVKPIMNKKAACFVTQFFPFKWMGGSQAIGQLKNICEAKGASVCGTGIVNWSNKRREEQIAGLMESFGGLF